MLAQRITGLFPAADVIKYKSALAANELPQQWSFSDNLIFIMATGIVVRAIAPLLKDKKTDPAVVVLDEKGDYVISLLSGHIGGANKLSKEIASFLNAQAVITTASDVQGKIALDVWAMEKGLYVENFEKLKKLSAKIVSGDKIKVRSEFNYQKKNMPAEFVMVGAGEEVEMVIAGRTTDEDVLFLRPRILFAGIGCNRGTEMAEIEETMNEIFAQENLSLYSIMSLASIDVKKDECGLIEFAHNQGLDMVFFTKDELNDSAMKYDIAGSSVVEAATGAIAVAEPAALFAAEKRFNKIKLILPKQKRGNVTLAIAEAEFTL